MAPVTILDFVGSEAVKYGMQAK